MIYLFAANGFALLAALTFYSASPHQVLAKKRLPSKTLHAVSATMTLLAFLCLRNIMAIPASAFLLLTVLMTFWCTLPLAISLYSKRYQDSKLTEANEQKTSRRMKTHP